MKLKCPYCNYYFQDVLVLHDGSSFVKFMCGDKKGNLLLHNEPFMKIVDSEYCKCPQCGEVYPGGRIGK